MSEKNETELPPANMQNKPIKQLYHESLFIPASNTDFGFSVGVLAATPNPQNAVYKGLHQCYSADPVEANFKPSEMDSGNIAVKRLLEGDRGHYSPFEHATITLVLGGINHGTIQQLIRSRIGVSFSIQSFRYTSEQILKAADGTTDVERIAYLRPVGKYHDREISYDYTQKTRAEDLSVVSFLIKHVAKRIREGMPAEQARGMLGFDYRQHGVVTFNTRSFMGFFDRRSKKDAQIEIRILAELLLEKFHQWQPVVADYYIKNRWGKAKLAP
jgi:thymidylate synthase (FAD)